MDSFSGRALRIEVDGWYALQVSMGRARLCRFRDPATHISVKPRLSETAVSCLILAKCFSLAKRLLRLAFSLARSLTSEMTLAEKFASYSSPSMRASISPIDRCARVACLVCSLVTATVCTCLAESNENCLSRWQSTRQSSADGGGGGRDGVEPPDEERVDHSIDGRSSAEG